MDFQAIVKAYPSIVTLDESFVNYGLDANGNKVSIVQSNVDAARAEGYSDLLAPPTFPFMLESDALELAELCDFFGQKVKHLLHAEQKFTYHQPICAGDQIIYQNHPGNF